MNNPYAYTNPKKMAGRPVLLFAYVIVLACTAGLTEISLHAQEADKGGVAAVFIPRTADIPDLAWTPRSDWINVKDTETFPVNTASMDEDSIDTQNEPAKGDGVADDTDVIEYLLGKLRNGDTLYFPAGKYRITRTLRIAAGEKKSWLGINLIGHGRSTVLLWDGPAGGVMFQQNNGWVISGYNGLTWDGNGKAATGILHRSLNRFETEIRHENEAFRNFTHAGIHLGGGWLATAEVIYENCLFENCKTGIFINGADLRSDNNKPNFNYLDNNVYGCEFRRCERGVFAGAGSNAYIRECHFEQSSACDVTVNGEAGNSIRRCTSQNSRRFVMNGSSVGPLVIQDCQVENTEIRNYDKEPVIGLTRDNAPVLLFDNAVRLASGSQFNPKINPVFGEVPDVRLFIANNTLSVGQEQPATVIPATAAYTVPLGAGGNCLLSAKEYFLRSEVKVPHKIFDARRDFGAAGDGVKDDTAAIQKTIDAAREHGRDALAYLPKGQYAIRTTLKMDGANYRVGGCGFGTALISGVPAGEVTLKVSDPDHLSLENIVIGGHDYAQGKNALDIMQTNTGSGKPSFMTYYRVRVFGMYQKAPNVRGLQLINLGKNDKVIFNEINGNLRFTDCGQATIYLALSYEGTLCVEGKTCGRDGFIGGSVRLGTVTNPGLMVKDNHSIVISDFYVESSDQIATLEGSLEFPAGRVVLQGPKYEISENSTLPSMQINNYYGDLLLGPDNFYVGNKIHRFAQQGSAPFTLVLWAGNYYNSIPGIEMSGTSKCLRIGSRRLGESAAPGDVPLFDDTQPREPTLNKIAIALGDLQRLGKVAMSLTRNR